MSDMPSREGSWTPERGLQLDNPDQGAEEALSAPLQGSELGRHLAAIEDDYANDVAAADALFSRVNQLATATRQAAIEAATWRRDLRLYHANNQPSEVVQSDQHTEQAAG